MAAFKDSIANSLFKEVNEIKKKSKKWLMNIRGHTFLSTDNSYQQLSSYMSKYFICFRTFGVFIGINSIKTKGCSLIMSSTI